jgi:hypothetical protein
MILTEDTLEHPQIQDLGEIPNRSNLRLNLYRNTAAIGEVRFVADWRFAESDTEVFQTLVDPDFDPRNVVLLSTKIDGLPELRKTNDIKGSPAKLEKLHSNSWSSLWKSSIDYDGFLVFSEPYYPGWHVEIDGIAVSMWQANYAFSAVFLQAGEHTIRRYYQPNSLVAGMISSGLFSLVLGVGVFYKGKRKSKGEKL